jgi:hypothetical protein
MWVILGTTVLLGATACGNDSSETASAGSGGGGNSGGGMTVSIVEPSDGAAIKVPFNLKVNSSVPLGTTESGQHHVHLFFDGNDKNYEVVEADTMEINSSSKALKGVSPGKHELDISLRNADHSAAGAETKIMVDLGEGGGQPPSTGDTGGGGGGY